MVKCRLTASGDALEVAYVAGRVESNIQLAVVPLREVRNSKILLVRFHKPSIVKLTKQEMQSKTSL